jgi:hypothetical protein
MTPSQIAGVGLMFPRADRPVAVEYPEDAVITLHPIVGLEFVEDAVTALGSSTELATHLFRECWAEGTGSDTDLCRAFSTPQETPLIGGQPPLRWAARVGLRVAPLLSGWLGTPSSSSALV